MVGMLLKILGVIGLGAGLLGLVIGGVLFIYGQNEVNDANDHFLFQDGRQARNGEEAADAGVQVMGTSLLVSGAGLVLLVAGIAVGGSGTVAPQQQQQQVVILTAPNDPPRAP